VPRGIPPGKKLKKDRPRDLKEKRPAKEEGGKSKTLEKAAARGKNKRTHLGGKACLGGKPIGVSLLTNESGFEKKLRGQTTTPRTTVKMGRGNL